MADITIYKPASVSIDVIDGLPPTDQSALVAQLQAQVADLTAQLAAANSKIANAQAALA
jgi:multidrug resistance efflux pump